MARTALQSPRGTGVRLVHLPASKQPTVDVIRDAHGPAESVLLLWSTFCQLGSDLGGQAPAMQWLRELVVETGRPIAFSAPSCDRAAEAHIFTPGAWSEERTLGWLGGLHEEVESMLGATTVFHERSDGFRDL
jgi:hypothetical protein